VASRGCRSHATWPACHFLTAAIATRLSRPDEQRWSTNATPAIRGGIQAKCHAEHPGCKGSARGLRGALQVEIIKIGIHDTRRAQQLPVVKMRQHPCQCGSFTYNSKYRRRTFSVTISHSPITLANLSSINLVSIFRCSRNPVPRATQCMWDV
jgi:hypothetical protein